jgi:hypothetical protein
MHATFSSRIFALLAFLILASLGITMHKTRVEHSGSKK